MTTTRATTAPTIRNLIADGRVHVMDGAMGTLLYNRGVFVNVCYDELAVTQPELVQELHHEYVEAGAEIIGSVIRGPAIIGANARIEHAYVGPFTSIMNDVEIRESELEHSIVLEGSVLSDLASRVIDSLIGRNVRIIRQPVKPSAYRFMLGDNSEVGIRW